MKKTQHWIVWVLTLLGGLQLKAQQDPMYTQYMYNTQVVNPAYAGSRKALTVTGLTRFQWTGFEGNPVTQTITMHTPLPIQNFGIGISMSRDEIAETVISNGQVDFAYRFPLSKHSQLAFGLKGTLSRFSENLGSVKLPDPVDQAFSDGTQGRTLPNIGAGIYLGHDQYYIGLSVPEIFENHLRNNTVVSSISGLKQRHYYAIAGMVFNLENRLQFKPTALVKYTANVPLQVDLTPSLIIRERIITGLMYRYHESVGLLVGCNLTEQLMLSYSFDWSFGFNTGRYNSGSHEFALRYDFLYKHSKGAKSPRYF